MSIKFCKICNKEFECLPKTRKTYCSNTCYTKFRKSYVKEYITKNRIRICENQKRFYKKNIQNRRDNQLKYYYSTWKSYLYNLSKYHYRKDYGITTDILLNILEKQEFKCAISGIQLTHARGSIYNASIDRIRAGQEYSINNIQLVCKCVNSWRKDTELGVFIEICRIITQYQAQKKIIFGCVKQSV